MVTNPEFEGREKEFLRVQIARIVHATTICPDGLWDKDEETGGIALKDEDTKETKGTNELNSIDQWMWLRPCFLPSGNLKAKEVEEDAEQEEEKKDEKRETTVERLVKLDTDKDFWKMSLNGFSDVHKLDGKDVC